MVELLPQPSMTAVCNGDSNTIDEPTYQTLPAPDKNDMNNSDVDELIHQNLPGAENNDDSSDVNNFTHQTPPEAENSDKNSNVDNINKSFLLLTNEEFDKILSNATFRYLKSLNQISGCQHLLFGALSSSGYFQQQRTKIVCMPCVEPT